MVEPLRHRQTKGAETDMPSLPPPRHIPTLPRADFRLRGAHCLVLALGQRRSRRRNLSSLVKRSAMGIHRAKLPTARPPGTAFFCPLPILLALPIGRRLRKRAGQRV